MGGCTRPARIRKVPDETQRGRGVSRWGSGRVNLPALNLSSCIPALPTPCVGMGGADSPAAQPLGPKAPVWRPSWERAPGRGLLGGTSACLGGGSGSRLRVTGGEAEAQSGHPPTGADLWRVGGLGSRTGHGRLLGNPVWSLEVCVSAHFPLVASRTHELQGNAVLAPEGALVTSCQDPHGSQSDSRPVGCARHARPPPGLSLAPREAMTQRTSEAAAFRLSVTFLPSSRP